MNLSKNFFKKAIFVTLAAASALAAGSASAGSRLSPTTLVIANNNPGATCVRAYVNGKQYNLNGQNQVVTTTNVSNNKSYMASVFKGQKCGGAAIKNVWFWVGNDYVYQWYVQ